MQGLRSYYRAGRALMFDICVQNGSISPVVRAQIQADFAEYQSHPIRLRACGSSQIDAVAAARSEFVNDVRIRKLTIAEGTGYRPRDPV